MHCFVSSPFSPSSRILLVFTFTFIHVHVHLVVCPPSAFLIYSTATECDMIVSL